MGSLPPHSFPLTPHSFLLPPYLLPSTTAQKPIHHTLCNTTHDIPSGPGGLHAGVVLRGGLCKAGGGGKSQPCSTPSCPCCCSASSPIAWPHLSMPQPLSLRCRELFYATIPMQSTVILARLAAMACSAPSQHSGVWRRVRPGGEGITSTGPQPQIPPLQHYPTCQQGGIAGRYRVILTSHCIQGSQKLVGGRYLAEG